MRCRLPLIGLGPLLLLAAAVAAAAPPGLLTGEPAPGEAEDPVGLRLAWSVDRARPGDAALLAVVFDIAPGWHIIADAGQLKPIPGFQPFATRIELVAAAAELTAENPVYPAAQPLKAGFAPGELMVFGGQAAAWIPVRIDPGAAPGVEAAVRLAVAYQACSDQVCRMPQRQTAAAALPIAERGAAVNARHPELFRAFAGRSPAGGAAGVEFRLFAWSFTLTAGSLALAAMAALGGLLLNLTPCVLPLIPIKILGITAAAARRGRSLALGGATFAGIAAFWLALGGAVSLASGFSATNQLFQHPPVPLAVGLLIAAMALGMFGAFSVRLPAWVYAFNPAGDTLPGAFGIGVLAALLSTPCTAPFMGTAAAWAVGQDPATALATFAAIGAGMGLPYLILAAAPGLVRWMPRSGPSGELLKQVMGLLMLAAAAYFIGAGASALAAEAPDPPSTLYWWPVALLAAAAGAWAGLRGARLARTRPAKVLWAAVALLALAAAVPAGRRLTDSGPVPWIAYTPERMEAAFSRGAPVVLAFTADWCLNCKALEQSVWKDPRLVDLFSRGGAVPVKADLTGDRPEAKAKLREAGSLTIPLVLVYSPQRAVVFRGDFYTADALLEAVSRAGAP
jgi:thiol:disulfide interchange protein DsbD